MLVQQSPYRRRRRIWHNRNRLSVTGGKICLDCKTCLAAARGKAISAATWHARIRHSRESPLTGISCSKRRPRRPRLRRRRRLSLHSAIAAGSVGDVSAADWLSSDSSRRPFHPPQAPAHSPPSDSAGSMQFGFSRHRTKSSAAAPSATASAPAFAAVASPSRYFLLTHRFCGNRRFRRLDNRHISLGLGRFGVRGILLPQTPQRASGEGRALACRCVGFRNCRPPCSACGSNRIATS